MTETKSEFWAPLIYHPSGAVDIEASRALVMELVAELRALDHDVHFELWNESFEGQAAINVMNGLPPDSDPSEVNGCFNDWLQPLFDDKPTR